MEKRLKKSSKHRILKHSRFSKINLTVFILVFACLGGYLIYSSLAASQTDIYIAQAGAGDGSSCANAHDTNWFNTAANWGLNDGQIGPGTTVHLCGTISTNLTFRGSGTSGNPITLLFEPGANISMPACPTRGVGCINTNNQTYLTIDGAGQGIIQNTAMGTGLANPVTSSMAIWAVNCSNCTIKNLTIQNMYIHTSTSDDGANSNEGIDFSGSNMVIANNTLHDIHWAMISSWNPTDSNIKIYNNNLYNVDHGIVSSEASFSGGNIGPIYIYNNHFHDYANWDSDNNAYHHDGIHCFTGNSAGYRPHYNGVYIYDNRFDGTTGNNISMQIYLEGNSGSKCSDSTSPFYIFNNYLTENTPINNGLIGGYSGVPHVYNNTLVGTTATAGLCMNSPGDGGAVLENNIMSDCQRLDSNATGSTTPFSLLDYNLYDKGGTYAWNYGGSYPAFSGSGWTSWQSLSGGDTHSCVTFGTGTGACPGGQTSAYLNSDGSPQSGSPAVGAGVNLTSLCTGDLTPLCKDINGNSRPASGAWDIGAYQYLASTPAPKIGDLNGDGKVTLSDLAILLTHYGQSVSASQGDLNGDGKVTLADLAILLTNYGR